MWLKDKYDKLKEKVAKFTGFTANRNYTPASAEAKEKFYKLMDP